MPPAQSFVYPPRVPEKKARPPITSRRITIKALPPTAPQHSSNWQAAACRSAELLLVDQNEGLRPSFRLKSNLGRLWFDDSVRADQIAAVELPCPSTDVDHTSCHRLLGSWPPSTLDTAFPFPYLFFFLHSPLGDHRARSSRQKSPSVVLESPPFPNPHPVPSLLDFLVRGGNLLGAHFFFTSRNPEDHRPPENRGGPKKRWIPPLFEGSHRVHCPPANLPFAALSSNDPPFP